MQSLNIRRLALFAANPNLLEEMIEANLVVRRNRRATIRGIGKWAREGMTGAVLCGVKVQPTVGELNAAISLARDVRVMRDH